MWSKCIFNPVLCYILCLSFHHTHLESEKFHLLVIMQDIAETLFPSATSCVFHFSLILTSYSSSTLVCGKDKYYILHRVVYFSLSLCNILWLWSFHHTHLDIYIQSAAIIFHSFIFFWTCLDFSILNFI